MNRKTWILVSDAAKAKLFEQQGRKLREVAGFIHSDSARHVGDFVSDSAGRRGMGGLNSPGLSAVTDPHEVEAEKFARQHADTLKQGLDTQRYEDLVLVAPPHFLGVLRKALDPQVGKRVVASYDQNYLHLDPSSLRDRLEALQGRENAPT